MRLLHLLAALPIWASASVPAFAVDPTGIPECDAFLSRYESCGLQILSGAEKLSFEKTVIESSMSARVGAGNPETRESFVKLCTDTANALRTNDTPFKSCMNQ